MSAATPALIAAAAGVGFGHAIMPDHWVPLAVTGRARRYPLARVARLSGLAGVAHVLVSLLLGAVIVGIGLQFRSTVENAQDAIVGAVLLATGLGFLVLEITGRGHSHSHDDCHPHSHSHDDGHPHDHDDRGHSHSRRARQTGGPTDEGGVLEEGLRLEIGGGLEDAGRVQKGGRLEEGQRTETGEGVEDAGRVQGGGRLRGLAGIMVPFGAAASPDLTILPVFLAAAAVGVGAAVGSLVAFALVTITTIVVLTLVATLGGYRVRGAWLDRWGNAITAVVLLTIGGLVLTGVI